MTDATDPIRALRAESNRAIAAHDAARCTAMMDPDLTLAVAGGPTLRGREAVRAAFAEQFADARFDRYVRTPEQITLETPTHAREYGRWVGRWRLGTDRHEQGGTYEAEWRLGALGWMVVVETYLEGG